jgi:hypothetical protein
MFAGDVGTRFVVNGPDEDVSIEEIEAPATLTVDAETGGPPLGVAFTADDVVCTEIVCPEYEVSESPEPGTVKSLEVPVGPDTC